MDTCTKCKKQKSLGEFHKNQYECKPCQSARRKQWHKDNKDRVKIRTRAANLKRKYGISVEEYDRMLALQDGVCWICKRPPKSKRLAVDHNHKTGKIRGLLCYNCNHRLLPCGKENQEIFQRAADYLNQK